MVSQISVHFLLPLPFLKPWYSLADHAQAFPLLDPHTFYERSFYIAGLSYDLHADEPQAHIATQISLLNSALDCVAGTSKELG